MSELSELEQRRRLVELSAGLQRATLSHRLNAIESRRGGMVMDVLLSLTAFTAKPYARRAAFALAALVWRRYRARRAFRA